ncbi:replicative DNA helicase [Deltaproteobacteria bacterium TL4]
MPSATSKTSPVDELLPHDMMAEKAVLGAIIMKNDLLPQISETLSSLDFFSPAHQKIFHAMLELDRRNEPIDELLLCRWLIDNNELEKTGGSDYLMELTQVTPVADNAIHYAQIIRETGQLREVITTAHEIAEAGKKGTADINSFILASTEKLKAIESRMRTRKYAHLKEVLLSNFEHLEQLSKNPAAVTGIPTGFTELDLLTRGLQRSDLVILAARPSMGKTAFAMNIAFYAAANAKVPVLIFSLEMPKEQLAMRLLCSEAKINSRKLWGGDLDGADWEKLFEATSHMMEAPLIIDDESGISPNHIRQVARQVQREHGSLGLIVVDYLQLMQSSSRVNSREQEISEISRNMKAIAKEFSVPVMALSQLNRDLERRPNKRPMMADLRESGALEQDADLIMFIYRDEVYNEDTEDQGIAEIIVAKHRNGELGNKRLAFIGQYTKFANLSIRNDD